MGRPKTGHTPLRTCRVCRTQAPKRDLERWVAVSETETRLDLTYTLPGRGWYTCREASCSRQAINVISGQARGLRARRASKTT